MGVEWVACHPETLYVVVTCHWCKRDIADAYYPDEETPYCDWDCYDNEARWMMWGAERWY